MDIVALFCDLDKFAVEFEPMMRRRLPSDGKRRRDRPCGLHLSEVMTILVLFHDSGCRTFKHFYLRHVCPHLRGEFPRLPSYNRFVERVPQAFLALAGFLRTRFGACEGIAFIDSTPLRVCHNARINGHRVMKGLAARGQPLHDPVPVDPGVVAHPQGRRVDEADPGAGPAGCGGRRTGASRACGTRSTNRL